MNCKVMFFCLALLPVAQIVRAETLMQVSKDHPLAWYCKNRDGSYKAMGSASSVELRARKLIVKEINHNDGTLTEKVISGTCAVYPNYLAKPW